MVVFHALLASWPWMETPTSSRYLYALSSFLPVKASGLRRLWGRFRLLPTTL